ncbi:DUF1385 domain-containing protein [Fusibacter tunisiensis]|jgi:uncharacterized protein YqhQ|uniref:Uncharacterized protein YqhQ n=1 Tax=Fusibacter tunisiensis TaxID=1008308 RepID=A0ABS2MPF6_9FIRM|nr:DUF1385 domain-containing protein [Fusibacter tunisiensis]MBM7561286.1 uncharacterized protein YqhQ [Fusibacter tunisiensis]
MSDYKPNGFTSIGGQALIEGVMMRGKETIAIAVRKPDGEIEMKTESVSAVSKMKLTKLPIFRGVFSLISSMVVGVRALTYSAEFYALDEAEEKDWFEKKLDKIFGEKADDVLLGFSIVFAFAFALLLFGVLPTGIVGFFKRFVESAWVLSAMEGVLKFAMFITYIVVISKMKEIKRVFEYHGAEHKTIHCYESGKEVTVENAKTFTTLHPRCGTSFMFYVLSISIILFSFLSWDNLLLRIVSKIVLLPVVAGLSYELIKLAGKSTHPIVKVLSAPGLWLQKLTTNEPDDAQLEVAIAAFKRVLEDEEK